MEVEKMLGEHRTYTLYFRWLLDDADEQGEDEKPG